MNGFLSQCVVQDAGALSPAEATKGAALTVGLTVAVAALVWTKGKHLGVALVLGAVAGAATKYAVDKVTA